MSASTDIISVFARSENPQQPHLPITKATDHQDISAFLLSENAMSTSLKIAIIGAGPAGLTLARLLQRNGISVTVFEAEPDRYSRNQGGSLDLHPKYGQLALAEVRSEGHAFAITYPDSCD